MKKILILLILFVTGCSLNPSYKSISYSKVKDMLKDKETFVLYIGSANCSHCKTFKPILEKAIADYDLTVYYLDIVNFSEADVAELSELTRFPKSTPTVLFIKDGVTDWQSGYNIINGSKDYDFVIEKFRNNGYIE